MYPVGHADSMRSLPSKASALAFAALILLSVASPATAESTSAVAVENDAGGIEDRAAVVVVGPQGVGTGCVPITINDDPPFVHPGIQWQCLDPVWKVIEDLLGSTPASLPPQVDI